MACDDEIPYPIEDVDIASENNDLAKERDQSGQRMQSIYRRYLNHIAEDETKSLIHMVPDVEVDERKKTFSARAREMVKDKRMHSRTKREWLGTFSHVTSGYRSTIGGPNSSLMRSLVSP